MQLDIQARDFTLTDALAAYIERRIRFILGSRYDQIKRINITLMDINGPRGGLDKRCQVRISLPRIRDIVIEDTQADLYIAIDRAADRAGRTLNRKLNRQLFKKRKIFIAHKHAMSLAYSDAINS